MNSFEDKLAIIRAGALGMASSNSMPEAYNGAGKQILTLIAVIRKQREALEWYATEELYSHPKESEWYKYKLFTIAQKALQGCEEML